MYAGQTLCLLIKASPAEIMPFSHAQLDPQTRDFYCQIIKMLNEAEIAFLIGGAYAFERYTTIARHTKDLDIFIRPADVCATLEVFHQAGYETEVVIPYWLAKAYGEDNFVDIIFNSAHGYLPVNDAWFGHAIQEEVLGLPVQLCAPEEMIWSKAYVMARDRFDGADIAHLIRAYGHSMDWSRLMTNFADHWRVLLAHLVLFGFIYPGERSQVPSWVMLHLNQKLQQEISCPEGADQLVCRGPLLSPSQYTIDVEQWNYEDARLKPRGNLSQDDIKLMVNLITES